MPSAERRAALRDMPGLARYLAVSENRVRPRLMLPQITPTTHHQKVAVFDRERLSVGGLDLNERRWDTLDHDQPAEETWHDVQLFIEDSDLSGSAARHILTLQRTTGGLMPPVAMPGLLRTLSCRRTPNLTRLSPKTIVNELGAAHRRRISGARRLIYIETQFLRDLQTASRLARAALRNPQLELLMVLPAAPEDVAFEGSRKMDARFGEFLQARCIKIIRRAFGRRAFVVAPAQPRRARSTGRDALWGAPIVYVHAKVSVFDDEAAIVASANLNGRSLYWDTELGVEITGRDDVERLRRRCFEHWLPEDADASLYQPETALEAWRRLALENLRRDPEDRRGFVLPYDPTPAERFGRDLPPVPNEMV
jgi:phospholipase D1/2